MTPTTAHLPRSRRDVGIAVAVLVLAAIVLFMHWSGPRSARPGVTVQVFGTDGNCPGVLVTLGGHSGTTGRDGSVTLPGPRFSGANTVKMVTQGGTVQTRELDLDATQYNDVTIGLIDNLPC